MSKFLTSFVVFSLSFLPPAFATSDFARKILSRTDLLPYRELYFPHHEVNAAVMEFKSGLNWLKTGDKYFEIFEILFPDFAHKRSAILRKWSGERHLYNSVLVLQTYEVLKAQHLGRHPNVIEKDLWGHGANFVSTLRFLNEHFEGRPIEFLSYLKNLFTEVLVGNPVSSEDRGTIVELLIDLPGIWNDVFNSSEPEINRALIGPVSQMLKEIIRPNASTCTGSL